jgi:hypothetical protein
VFSPVRFGFVAASRVCPSRVEKMVSPTSSSSSKIEGPSREKEESITGD